MNPFEENKEIEKELTEFAASVSPNPMFVKDLEKKLIDAHKPSRSFNLPAWQDLSAGMFRFAALAAFVLLVVWVVSGTQNQVASVDEYVCMATIPNGSMPPGETVESAEYLGNGELWTALTPDGKIYMQENNREADGSFSMKWGWWRIDAGLPISIEGRRLDADAPPLRADIPEGYDSNFQVSALVFPTTGCWEVTARAGESALSFIAEVVYGESAPEPEIIIQKTETPDDANTYEFRQAKLILNAPLPASPEQTNLYITLQPESASIAIARQLAEQFGIEGDVYVASAQIPGQSAFMVTDGAQQLMVYGENYYTYTSNMLESGRNYVGYKNANAENDIRTFLYERGIGFDFTIEESLYGGYILRENAPDGLPIMYESYSQPVMRVTFDQNGDVLSLTAMRLKYDPASLGTFGIISAEEAFANLMDDSAFAGKMENFSSGFLSNVSLPQNWYRNFEDGQTATIYGGVSINEAADPSKPDAFFLDNVLLTGDTSGMSALENYSAIEAKGSYYTEDGIRKFNVDSWSADSIVLLGYTVNARRDGERVILTNQDGSEDEYILIDPPADLPLDITYPESSLIVVGVLVGDTLEWTSIQYFEEYGGMGGGGGGGGMGFYAINLSGTPIPLPTPVQPEEEYTPAEIAGFARYTVQPGDTLESVALAFSADPGEIKRVNYIASDELIEGWVITIPGVAGPTRLDGERGVVRITNYQKPDGRIRTQYLFFHDNDQSYFELTGEGLESLKEYVNRPISIWGEINYDETGMAFLEFQKFEALYPGLDFEIMAGTQNLTEINGASVVLFTSNGKTYVQLDSVGGYPDQNIYTKGDVDMEVAMEVLIVPDETYGGYPALRVFTYAPAIDPVTRKPIKLNPMANAIETIPDPFGDADRYIPPDLIIEKIELIYYTSMPIPQMDAPLESVGGRYIQPVWHFVGRYTDGSRSDIYIQALQEEYLQPETVAFPAGG